MPSPGHWISSEYLDSTDLEWQPCVPTPSDNNIQRIWNTLHRHRHCDDFWARKHWQCHSDNKEYTAVQTVISSLITVTQQSLQNTRHFSSGEPTRPVANSNLSKPCYSSVRHSTGQWKLKKILLQKIVFRGIQRQVHCQLVAFNILSKKCVLDPVLINAENINS